MIYLTLQKDDMAKFGQRIQDQRSMSFYRCTRTQNASSCALTLETDSTAIFMCSLILGFIALTFYLAYFIFHLSIFLLWGLRIQFDHNVFQDQFK